MFPDGAVSAVSLSFDDARGSQLEGVRILDEHDLRATFYVLPDGVERAPERWRQIAAAGHEIGNHTRTHPCAESYEFSRHNALEDKDLPDIAADIDTASAAIEQVFTTRPLTFAYPCGQDYVGRGAQRRSYVPLVTDRFVAARGYGDQTGNDPRRRDLSRLRAYAIDELDERNLDAIVDAGIAAGEWVIMAGHEIGDPGEQTVLATALDRLCRRLAADERVWVAPVLTVAEHVLAQVS